MAQAGPDGVKVKELLQQAKATALAQFHALLTPAVARLLDNPDRKTLLTAAERSQLQLLLASIDGTANLLGRAAVRRRAGQAKAFSAHGGHPFKRFADEQTDFTCFADGVPLMLPEKALAWFKSLIPSLAAPARWVAGTIRRAFTMAVATEEGLLRQCQAAITRNLETGEDATPTVQNILDEAGVTPRQPNYSEMVVRTNMLQSLTRGMQEEVQDPEMQAIFPAWRYDGILDGRQGADHQIRFGKYYPVSLPFDTVRGPRVFNCRCVPTAIDSTEWDRLKKSGVSFSSV